MSEVSERYELRPVSELKAGDLMGTRMEVTGDPYGEKALRENLARVPVRNVLGCEDAVTPPYELSQLVPVLIEDDKAAVSRLAEVVRDMSAAAGSWRNRSEAAEASRDRLIKAARKVAAGLRELGVLPPGPAE